MDKGSDESLMLRSFSDLTKKQRRVIIIVVTARILIGNLLLALLYIAVPIRNESIHPVVVMLGMILVFAVVIGFSLRRIEHAQFPQIRAIQVGMLTLSFYLFAFSALYLSLSVTDTSYFTTDLDHVTAFYFTVTVFTTVGFGDITPNADPTQLIVSLQMLLNLLFIYVGLRAIMYVGKRRATEVRDSGPTAPTKK